MTPRSLFLLTRAIHLCLEYHAGYLADQNILWARGICDCQREIALLVREAA